jgi:DNA-cytosine methyltransferase
LGLKVLSLFDGMSCGQLALQRLGIEVDTYYASEIDKYAIQVTQANFPKTIQVGDVCQLKSEDYQDVDLILAGSPCQGFSFAGKQLAFDDPRSALFFEFVRLLKEIKPKYFLLENVKMKQQFQDVITEQVSACYPDFEGGDLLGGQIKPILINSALLSAQNRQRLYWTNIPNIEQPEDKGIVLRDILEDNFDSERDKSYCIDANYYKGASVEQYKKKSRRQLVSKPKQVGIAADIKGHDILKRVYSPDGKSPTLNTMGGGNREPKVAVEYKAMTEVRTPEANKIRREHKKKTGKDWSPREMRQLVERDDDKMNTLTSALTKQHIVQEKKQLIEEERIVVDKEKRQLLIAEATKKGYTVIEDGDCFDINFPNSKTRRGRNMKYKCNALTTASQNFMRFENLSWRKLLPLECERLQTVPDNYTNHVSNTQRYKMLGNGWTVEVIAHILNNMKL